MSFTVVHSKVTGKLNVADQILEKLHAFRVKSYKEPTGIVLGPHEYVGLISEMRKLMKYTHQYGHYEIAYPSEFMGFPISAKTTAGIDLTFDSRDVFNYCLHEMESP